MARPSNKNMSVLSTDYSDEDAIVAMVHNLWTHRPDARSVLDRQWYTNIAWYMGLQNLVWQNSTGRLVEPDHPSWRVRMIVNHLQGQIRTVASKIYKSAPEWDVLPATTDALDLQTAQISNQLLAANWYRMNMDEKSMEVLMWMLVTGNGFWQHTWDPDAGDPIFLPNDDTVELEDEDLLLGETDVDNVPPFEMLVDPGPTVFRDCAWALRSRVINIDELREMFPKAEEIALEQSETLTNFAMFQEHIKSLTSAVLQDRYTTSSTSRELRNTTIVHELWIRPRRRSRHGLKKGKYIVVSGNKVLNGSTGADFPYLHGELPFAHFKEVDIPGRLWGTSTLEQLLPLQSNYNRTKSQLVENRNLMSRPKWSVPRGAGLESTALTGSPGEIIHHNPGLSPQPVEPPNLPSYVQNMLQHDKQDMEDISGVHEVSRAEAPGQIRSGRGVLALVEQDESRLNMVIRDFELQIARIGSQNLSVSAQFVRETRLARVLGDNDELLMFAYSGNSLLGDNAGRPGVNYFDVRVRTVAGLPSSRAAQQQMLGSLVEFGVLQPQNRVADRRLFLKLLSIGRTVDHLDQARVHRSRQLQEIQRATEGGQIRAEQWHNHEIHLEVLNEFRNSAKYDLQPPEVKQQLELHSEQHKQWIAINAVEPNIMVQKAAMAVMVGQEMGKAGAAAQSEASNLLGGPAGVGQSPQAKPSQPQQLPGIQNTPANIQQGAS